MSPARSRPRQRRSSFNRHAFFARFNFRCVYHEGSEEAKRYRLDQLDVIAQRSAPQLRIDGIAGGLVIEEADFGAAAGDMAGNLFGLTVDHLIPRWVRRELDRYLDGRERRLVGDRWLVAACGECNEERKSVLESSDLLLFVYSRYVMPLRGTGLEQVQDALAFSKVLEKIERHLVSRAYREAARERRAV